jgi:hypothetical protein
VDVRNLEHGAAAPLGFDLAARLLTAKGELGSDPLCPKWSFPSLFLRLEPPALEQSSHGLQGIETFSLSDQAASP